MPDDDSPPKATHRAARARAKHKPRQSKASHAASAAHDGLDHDEAHEEHRPQRKTRRFSLVAQSRERRRAIISFSVGLLVLLLVQIPSVEQSFLGGPDRQMMEAAFKMRADVTAGTAEPVLFFDFDDHTIGKLAPTPFAPVAVTTPRASLADLLDFIRTGPPQQMPRVVVMDVDIAQAASDGDVGIARMQAALTAWSQSPSAPPLIIARESYPAADLGVNAPGLALPNTPYDPVVEKAPNIYWSTVKVLGDQNAEIREFLPYECVLTPSGVQPLFSAALLAYGFAERDPAVLAKASARHWMQDGAAQCQKAPTAQLAHGERIDYHISLDLGFSGRVWPALSKAWAGFKQCPGTDTAIFRRLSVIDILDAIHAGGDVSRELLCQHIVLIGGTNGAAGDFVQTPLNEMNGSVVLGNAIRGLELTHGGMRAIPLGFQVLLLAVVSLLMSGVALATDRARHRFQRLKRSPHKRRIAHTFGIISLNPIILNGVIAVSAHLVGVAILLVSLNFGLWGFLSAPVFAAAITETLQEFFDD
ncbi:MAG TPA: CHASE2 domain-containing protein [Caulobacteraceae bacterium]|jgi:CHASE2 domain-containing sensor protein